MPTYQYACTACEHRFEIVQSFSDSSLTECPECAGRLRKLYGSVGVVFKGSGFYRNDSRADQAKSSSSSSTDSGSSTGSGEKSGGEKDSTEKKSESTATSTATPNSGAKKESNSSSSTTGTTKPAAVAS